MRFNCAPLLHIYGDQHVIFKGHFLVSLSSLPPPTRARSEKRLALNPRQHRQNIEDDNWAHLRDGASGATVAEKAVSNPSSDLAIFSLLPMVNLRLLTPKVLRLGSVMYSTSALMERIPSRWPRPVWHAPWKIYRVISGHLGWVRSIAFDPSNKWFCTGSADCTIKTLNFMLHLFELIWDVGTGTLQLSLTGHIEQIRGLAVSSRHTYMFSAGDDKLVIRSYHGHLSGVYCLPLHPTLNILLTGGRDSVCRSVTLDTTQLLADYLFEPEDPVKAVKMSRKGLLEQDLSKLDVTKYYRSCAHGKSTVVKAISGVQLLYILKA
ncbi:pleiotropic regulatory locus 1 [Prunus dulcis]|uniref:Pleiotropic regulatory locus 1 n=1 Tax=Prunus dulcis TaxID=3755 RepID=A0A4Y1RIC0_PRUDU|nr:pleiotropic regulatory locus 1 [Prunus dulcis]